MIVTSDIKFQERLRQWAKYLVCTILLIAVLVLTGWQFDIRYFIHPLPKLPAMNPTTAVGFVLFALSFFLLTGEKKSSQNQKAGKALAFIIILIGAVKSSELIFRYESNIDVLLFPFKVFNEVSNPLYAHMSPVAAVCFMLSGISLLFLNFETRRKRAPAQYMALFIAYFGLASFLGYIFTVRAFYGDLKYVTMAIHTGISFIFVSLAILFATPDRGLVKELTKPFAGSIVARRLIPIAVLIPVILGLGRLYLELNGIVTYEVGITVVIMCVIMSLLGFIFYTTRLLNKRDFESKEAGEALAETNYFLNTVLENIPNMIFVKDAKELRFFRFNKAGEELLGYSRADLIGKNDYDFFPKEQADFFTARDRDVLNSPSVMDIAEEPIMTNSGERWLHTKKIPLRDENGIPLYLVGISEDITERRKINEQLKQLNAELENRITESIAGKNRFSTIFYKSPVMNIITDIRTGRFLEVNDAFADFVAHDKDEMIGKTSLELNLVVRTEMRDELLDKLHKDGYIKDIETQIRSRNGEKRWVSSSTSKINLNGKDCYLTAIVDITVRKSVEEKLLKLSQELEQKVLERTEELARSEAKFRLLVENSHEAIIMSDKNIVPFYRSPAADSITGWTTAERLKLKSQFDLTHPDDVDYIKQAFQEAFANPGKPIRVTFRTLHKAGHYIWVEGLVNNLLHDEGLQALVFNFHDITERKINELKVKQNEQRFRKLLENNYESISLIDEQLQPLYRSPGADRITGWTMEERIKAGGPMDDTHPDDLEKMKAAMKFVMGNPGMSLPVAFRTRHKDGHYIWLEGFLTNMLHDESLKGILGNFRDVTERKQYESKIEQSELRFRKLLENNFEDITLSDENFIPFYRSPSATRITGWTTEERIAARGGYDCTHPDDMDGVRNAMKEVLAKSGKVVPVTFRTRHKEGHYIWLEGFLCNMLHDESIRGIIANFRDVTERKIYESKIKQSELRFRKILENNYEVITLSDKNFIPFYRSPATERITGRTNEVRRKFGLGILLAHPDDRENLKKAMKEVSENPGKNFPVTFRQKHEDGHYIWFEGFLTNMLHDPSINAIVANYRDVTERKEYEKKTEQSEQKFRNLLENNYEIISLLDEKFIPFYRSPAARRFTGWTIDEGINAGGVIEQTHPDDKQLLKNVMQKVLASKGKPVPVCFRALHKDGYYIWLEGFMTNMLHDESLKGIISNLRDVTKRKEAEEEINILTEELRHLIDHTQALREEERKYIAREIHDELGQRLTALKIDVSMLRRKMPVTGKQNYVSEEINSFIGQIDQSIESVKRIATDLRPEILDHHGIIAAVKWQAEKFESKTGVQCKVTPLPEEINLPSEVTTAVYRAVQEALTNIARHAKATSVNIFLELDAKKLLVEIKDNGKGINQEQVKSMTSLGLIGIRERVHLLKGSFSITGKPGKGTLVSITIPI